MTTETYVNGVTLRNRGLPDSHRLQVYQDTGGYQALRKVLLEGMTPEQRAKWEAAKPALENAKTSRKAAALEAASAAAKPKPFKPAPAGEQ